MSRSRMWRCVIGAGIPAAYVLAYAALLSPPHFVLPYPKTPRPWIYDRPTEYRFGGSIAATLFWPVNWIDRRLRPAAWRIDVERLLPPGPGV